MVAQEDGTAEPTAVGWWSETLEELHRRIAHRFACLEARERAKRFLLGSLGRSERKRMAGRWTRLWASPILRASSASRTRREVGHRSRPRRLEAATRWSTLVTR